MWRRQTSRKGVPALRKPAKLPAGRYRRRLPEAPPLPPPLTLRAGGRPLFLGAAAQGPLEEAVSCHSWLDYWRCFMAPEATDAAPDPATPPAAAGRLDEALRLFFLNGGQRAQVMRASAGAEGLPPALARASDFDLLALPDLAEASEPKPWEAALAFCRERRALLLVDPPPGLHSVAAATAWIAARPGLQDANAACYLPWVTVKAADGSLRALPPSGAVAGVIARVEQTQGLKKSPAGPGAELRGLAGLAWNISAARQADLNPLGLNALRSFPGRGATVYGARLLSAADPERRYLAPRRLVLALEEALATQLGWVVFEPNAEPLWARLRGVCETLLLELWRQGALQGASAREAFFVRCDRSTMTDLDRAEGRILLLLGLALIRPAEFVILRAVLPAASG